MRIGEVAIISYKSHEKENFIRSICQKIDIKDETLSFGRFEINDQLALYLYGINFDYRKNSISWDLVSRKTLGFIIIFDWEDKKAFEATKNTLGKIILRKTNHLIFQFYMLSFYPTIVKLIFFL